jgi:hypothetical protein
MEVGVIEVNKGRPGGKRQRLDKRPERLHTKFLWADEVVEGTQVDDGSPNARFLLGSKEESQSESLAPGFGWNKADGPFLKESLDLQLQRLPLGALCSDGGRMEDGSGWRSARELEGVAGDGCENPFV